MVTICILKSNSKLVIHRKVVVLPESIKENVGTELLNLQSTSVPQKSKPSQPLTAILIVVSFYSFYYCSGGANY